MMTNFNFIGLDALMERLMSNKYTKTLKRDMVIQYVQDFYAVCDFRDIYVNKVDEIKISKHKGILPCGCMYVIQVKNLMTGHCLSESLDNFLLSDKPKNPMDASFKIQGNVLITSIPFGEFEVSYLSTQVSERGEIMIPDDPMFMIALECYIKKIVYFDLFEQGKINANVFNVVEQDYYWNVGKLRAEHNTPSHSEMQSLSNVMNRPLWQNESDFVHGYSKANYIHKMRVTR